MRIQDAKRKIAKAARGIIDTTIILLFSIIAIILSILVIICYAPFIMLFFTMFCVVKLFKIILGGESR